MKLFSIVFLTLSITTSILNAQAIQINKGWQLLGTSEKIENMEVFREDCTPEIVAYRNNTWLKYNNTDKSLTYIDNQEGFWALGETNCTIQTTIVTPPVITTPSNTSNQPAPETEITQDVSHINNETTIFSSDVRLTYNEAVEYCKEYDAYLPTKDEQMAHYLYVIQSGRLYSSGRHWSSSEASENTEYAYEVILYFALQTPKTTKLFARCIKD